ncbi:YCF48-related protein [Paraburkholderia sp. IMGN_8]|uniref:WD40/YVTN/BNR-like repeat-containing protein n=1 Tax=Paraburkholderia sp. IMGN_8 TaxID=3136564 RepID=UPI0031018500
MQRFARTVLSILPLVIIGGLLYAAFFVKPTVGANRVQPPAVQRGEFIYGIASSPSGVVLGAGSGGKIWRTVDLGKSMTVTQSPTTANLQDIAAWSNSEAVAVGDAGAVIVTRNSGQSWTPVKVTLSSIANKLIRVRIFDDGNAWIVGEMGAALRSTDRGATWNRMTPEEDKAWNDVFVSGDRVWLVGEFGRISESKDAGHTWTNIASPVKSSLMAITFRDEQHGVAVGVDGAVVTTIDGGDTWTAVRPMSTGHLFDLAWNGKQWLAVGERGVLLIGDATVTNWRVSRVSPDNRQWHTKIIREGQQYLASGGSLDVVDAR